MINKKGDDPSLIFENYLDLFYGLNEAQKCFMSTQSWELATIEGLYMETFDAIACNLWKTFAFPFEHFFAISAMIEINLLAYYIPKCKLCTIKN